MSEGAPPIPYPRLAVLAGVVLLVTAIYLTGADEYFSIDGVKARLAGAQAAFLERPIATITIFVAIQVAALSVCLPGAVLGPALAGGALFGPWLGTLVLLLALTIGDSIGFLLARYVAGDWLAERFARRLRQIERNEGIVYLLALRMMAIVPYFVVNLAMAMTRMPLRHFAPASFVGLIPATLLYVHAGSELSSIEQPSDIWSGPMITIFAMIGILPLAARWTYRFWRERSV